MNIIEKLRYLDFLDPTHIIWRRGTADDPYVDKIDIVPVVNQRIVLSEIPDKTNRVQIPSMEEINYKKYSEISLKENQFYVDYTNGIVHFHAIKEAQTMSVTYKGRGLILYPSSRIYHHDSDTNIIVSLQEITQEALDRMKQLGATEQELLVLKQSLENAIEDNQLSADQLKQIIESGTLAVSLVENAYQTTQLIYKPFVETYGDILEQYPSPSVGWTTLTTTDGIRYRWNGAEWTPIDILGGNIPLANEHIDGLFSKEDFIKLKGITDNVDIRVIVFFISDEIFFGVQSPHFGFPFDGKIEEITASIPSPGESNTIIQVEKSTDYQNWDNITPNPIVIEKDEYFNNQNYEVLPQVNAGDIFRLNVLQASNISNLNLNIKINTKN